MAKPTQSQTERVADLGQGLAIWRVHLDAIREQDVNARVMDNPKFERLVDNIRREKRLESLPFATLRKNDSGNLEFELISGHHRVRAARVAEVLEIYMLVDERQLSRDQIVSKQLSHNSIQGNDDAQILKTLYDSIEEVDYKIQSGLSDQELEMSLKNVQSDDVKFDLKFEIINLLFLPHQYEKWTEAIDMLDKDAHIGVVDKQYWDDFAETVREVAKRDNVRNMTAIVGRMVEIVGEYYAAKDEQTTEKPKKNS